MSGCGLSCVQRATIVRVLPEEHNYTLVLWDVHSVCITYAMKLF